MESLWARKVFSSRDFDRFKYLESPTSAGQSAGGQTLQAQGTGLCATCKGTGETEPNDWPSEDKIRGADGWKTWLEKVEIESTKSDTLSVVISPRRQPEERNQKYKDTPALLKYLCMDKPSFKAIVDELCLHPSLSILVNHGSPTISTVKLWDRRVYTLRVEHTLVHQTAMTITHLPERPGMTRGRTNAMILGYDDHDIDNLKVCLEDCKDAALSPFTLIKAFMHVERNHRFHEVNNKIAALQSILQNSHPVPVGSESSAAARADGDPKDPKDLIRLYLGVYTLKNALTAWRVQLLAFREAVGAGTELGAATRADIDPSEYLRLLAAEYDSKINKCDLVLEGASLAFQMETANLAQKTANLSQETANLSRMDTQISLRDGKQMKAIAVLTMIFLPATFVATLLAVPQFKGMENVKNIPSWAWYLILFLPLTAIVLGFYSLWIMCYRPRKPDNSYGMV